MHIEIRRILYPTDLSELSLAALTYARTFAVQHQAELHCYYVVDDAYQSWSALGPESVPVVPVTEDLINAATKQMDAFVAKHLGDLNISVIVDVGNGRPYYEIVQYAAEHDIDLIVIATHGHTGFKHALLGSTAERVVRHAPCPVLTIRHPEHDFVVPEE